jgi:hypothetical protein
MIIMEEKLFGIKIFEWEEYDLLENVTQYYDVKWSFKELEKYNSRIITVTTNWDIEIYNEDGTAVDKKFNIIEVAEFKEKLKELM